MNFFKTFIVEALTIVKKNDKNFKELPKYDQKLNAPKQPEENDLLIGKVGKFDLYKTFHVSHTRDYETTPRDYGMDKQEYLRIMNKFIQKITPENNKKYHIFYRKDGVGKYNDLVVSVNGNRITIVTIIQGNRNSPMNYYTNPDEKKAVVEALFDIEVVFIDKY